MNDSLIRVVLFYFLGAITLGGAALVAFSRNIVHSAFALLGTFAGVAGLYAYLSADLVAVIQVMVYVGGVLILILFAVMLTARIEHTEVSNPTLGRVPGWLALLATAAVLVFTGISVFGHRVQPAVPGPTTGLIGDALLSRYVLPFEVISVLLLAALLGAVTIAGGRLRRPTGDRSKEEAL